MNEQNWERKQYETWDEAFRGLVPVIRQQSVRVAAYTQVLFAQACDSSLGNNNPESKLRMQGQNIDLAYKCALYHQLGKAILPPEIQVLSKDFSDEQKACYRTYPAEGRLLVSKLQDKKTTEEERPTNNLSWLMIRETCEQHMERWDGSGFPDGRVGDEISPIAQIVGLAKELDRLVTEIKSENPFDEAYVILRQQAGTAFSEGLIEILNASRGKCRGIYKKYIQYSKTIPKTIPLVDKRKDRPMGLRYRQIGTMYEAIPWFGGVLKQPDKRESLGMLEPMMMRTKMIKDVMFYLLYEASDTLLHLKNAQLQCDGILLSLPAGFYQGDSIQNNYEQMLLDQPIDSSKLMLGVPSMMVSLASKEEKEHLVTYIESGIQLVLDGYRPELLTLEQIQEIGFSKVRIAAELQEAQREEMIGMLLQHGITLVDHGVWDTDVEEDELVRNLLLNER